MVEVADTAIATSRVCILGSRAAGKTCFLAGLAVLAEPSRTEHFQVVAQGATKARLAELAETLHRQQWPAATTTTEIHPLAVLIGSDKIELVVIDYPGEDLENELRLLQPERIRALYEHYQSSQTLLLLMDPQGDVLPNDTFTPDELRARESRLDALLSAIQNVALPGRATPGKIAKPRDIAILLTKADTIPGLIGPAEAQHFFRTHAPRLDAKLRLLADGIAYFPLSSVGEVEMVVGESGNYPVPSPNLHPTGYEAIFQWIRKRRLIRSQRPALRTLIAGLLVVFGIFGLAVGLEYAQHWRLQAILADEALDRSERLERTRELTLWYDAPIVEGRRKLVEEALIALKSDLAKVTTESGFIEVEKRIDRLDKGYSGSLQGQVRELRQLARDHREELLFRRVQQAYQQKLPDFMDLANRYQREFQKRERTEQIALWQRSHSEENRGADRAAIKQATVFNSATLVARAEKIHAYLDKWGRTEEPATAAQMQRAADLALRFSQPRQYTLKLKSSGDFTAGQTHRVPIFVAGSMVKYFVSPDSARTIHWTNSSVQLTWKSGESVEVQLNRGWVGSSWTITNAAMLHDDTPLAILRLAEKTKLNAYTGREADFAGEPFVEFELEGISADDLHAIRAYLVPGDRW